MRLGNAADGTVCWDEASARWSTELDAAPADVVALLTGAVGARDISPTAPNPARDAAGQTDPRIEGTDQDPQAPRGLPFHPVSLRGVMVSESHYVRGARTMVRHFMPRPIGRFIGAYEAVTRRTFPALRPPARFYEEPAFYFGHAVGIVPDGATVRYPAGCRYRDFELELGAIVTRAWDAATQGPPRAADVIGAFTVLNDFSARDLQWADERRGAFSGVIKAKSFATGMGSVVVTADEILPRAGSITGRVRVNGEVWCDGSTAGALFDLDAVIAHIARDERLVPGEVISLGTLPGCCGLELDRFLQPGDEVGLELDGVGTLTNTVGA